MEELHLSLEQQLHPNLNDNGTMSDKRGRAGGHTIRPHSFLYRLQGQRDEDIITPEKNTYLSRIDELESQ